MRVYHDLRALSYEDYAHALSRYVGEASQASGVAAVFQFGEVTEPGISDLDLLVVVRDEVSAAALGRIIAATRTDSTARYLFAHAPVVVPQSLAGDVAWIHTLYHLRHVWGDTLEIPQPPVQIRGALALAEYVDFTFAARTALRGLAEADVGLRGLLLLLKSCLHSLRLASSITGQPFGGDLEGRVSRLRQDGLAGQSSDGALLEQAAAAARECVAVLRRADCELETHLLRWGLIDPAPLSECVSYLDGRYYRFEAPSPVVCSPDPWPRAAAGGWWRRLGVDPSVVVFPGFYLAQFAVYGTGTGPHAMTHRAVFGQRAAELILDPTYRSVLLTRSRIVQRVYDVVGPAGLLPMVPLGVGFRAPERIRLSRRRQLLRGAVARASAAGGR